MSENEIFYSALLFFVAVISTAVSGIVWRRRSAPGAHAVIVYMAAIAWWSATYALFWANLSPSRPFWLNATYFGAVTVSPAFLVFALQFTGHQKWLSRPIWALLIGMAVATVVLLWTDPWHNLFFGGHRNPLDTTIYSAGPWFWTFIFYSYCLNALLTAVLIARFLTARSLYRQQLGLVLIAALIPWFANFVGLVQLNPLPALDLTPIAFSLTGIIITLSLFRYRFLDVAPIARDKLIENMKDGILVLDKQNRVVDVNPALITLFGTAAPLIGEPMQELFPHWSSLAKTFAGHESVEQEIQMAGTPSRFLHVRFIGLRDRAGSEQGSLLILQDVTARKALETEREELINTLQTALSQVKTLRGLLPICASCKKIRDDQGYWQDVTVYVRDHTEANFTHGMCPDCMKKYYPDYFEKRAK